MDDILVNSPTIESAKARLSVEFGEPVKTTSKLAAWQTATGSQLALTLDGKSVRVWLEQEPPPELQLAIVDYPPTRSRLSNLKSAAPRLAQPFPSYLASVDTHEQLDGLIVWYKTRSEDLLNAEQLANMKQTFLDAMPGFESFETPGERYSSRERNYKDQFANVLHEVVLPLVPAARTSDAGAKALLTAFIDLYTKTFSGSEGRAQNLVNWRSIDRLKPQTEEQAIERGRAIAALFNTTNSVEQRMADFIQFMVDRAQEGSQSSAADQARVFGGCTLMLLEPTSAILVRWNLFDRALQLLWRRKISDSNLSHLDRYTLGLNLAQAIYKHMEDEWDWAPKDLIDVQSFLWIVFEHMITQDTFAHAMERFVDRFGEARQSPFQKDEALWDLGARIVSTLCALHSIKARPDLKVDWSPGKGVWANVPWISILDTKVTTTTQDGTYIVFLIANDLQSVYLTLNQGVTRAITLLGQGPGIASIEEQAQNFRAQIPNLTSEGFDLTGNIDLGTNGTLARNYERGTIASLKLDVEDLPDDETLNELMESLLTAYEEISGASDLSESDTQVSYSIDDALADVFMDREKFETILNIWRAKKNIILQGAPGVGKSFIAKRLAYALMGEKAEFRVEVVQFHQSYGYEDFIQGYRPTDTGGFELKDGVFHRFCRRAEADPEHEYVFIIDEINRGNLSKIFGELMLLIEHDKRSKEWATRLAYATDEDEAFWIPENVYVVGMMNTADRSLSLVDYALRRRFAFKTLEPSFSHIGFTNHLEASGVPKATISHIVRSMGALNQAIAEDTAGLGPGFRIGHSFFVPGRAFSYSNGWLPQIIETEIFPLLEEYWFDAPDKAARWRTQLLG